MIKKRLVTVLFRTVPISCFKVETVRELVFFLFIQFVVAIYGNMWQWRWAGKAVAAQ